MSSSHNPLSLSSQTLPFPFLPDPGPPSVTPDAAPEHGAPWPRLPSLSTVTDTRLLDSALDGREPVPQKESALRSPAPSLFLTPCDARLMDSALDGREPVPQKESALRSPAPSLFVTPCDARLMHG